MCRLASTVASCWIAELPGRLEAATSRLEDIATSTELPKDVPALKQAIASPAVESQAPTPPQTAAASAKTTSSQSEDPVPESIEEFQQFISSSVGKYVKISTELGGVVAKQVRAILEWAKLLTVVDQMLMSMPLYRLSRCLKDSKNRESFC